MQKPAHSIFFIVMLVLLIGCLPRVASDIYAPSLPAIARHFNTPIHFAQWTMAIYMFGVAICALIYGPLSDGIGRKLPLLIGLSIGAIGTVLCLLAPNIILLLIGRFIQGCGIGACASLWRSIFRDVFTGEDLAKYGSYFTAMVTFVVPAAPTLGGYLQQYIGWRATFAFLTLYVITALYVVIVHYRETSQHHHYFRLKPQFVSQAFLHLFSSRIFLGYTISVLLSYGAFFAWFTIGPVLLIHFADLSPAQFGLLNLISGGFGMGLGGLMNARLVKRCGTHAMLQFGWGMMLISGAGMLAIYIALGINIAGIMLCLFLFYFGTVFIWPNAFACVMTPFGKIAGYTGACYSALQLGGGALVSAIAAHIPAHTPVPFAVIILVCTSGAWAVYRCVAYPMVCPKARLRSS